MKPATLIFLLLILIAAGCKNPKPDLSGLKDDVDATKMDTQDMSDSTVPEMDSAAMNRAYEAWMTPGDMHKWMSKWDGTWTADVTAYMDPSAPEKSTATVVNKMAMNGLYQMSDYTGTMMGMPFQGHGIMAYDNAKKEFVSTWIDNMGSGIMVMTGQFDAATNTLHLKGTSTDPLTGKDAMIRQEVKYVDDNTHSFTIWGEMQGKEEKFMDATMKRKS